MNFETVTKFDKDVKKLSKKYNLIKQDLQNFILNFDDVHKEAIFIKNNLFKVRVTNSNKNKGKSSGYRIYYYLKINVAIYLLTIYDKSKIESINENSLNQYITEIMKNSKID
jgi:mRNA-degrading endonuclease RelE of RelBE toxin-antitoxin system